MNDQDENGILMFCKTIFKIPEISQQISDYLSYVLNPDE